MNALVETSFQSWGEEIKGRSDVELLAQFLGNKQSGFSCHDEARILINKAGGLRELLSNPEDYFQFSDIERIYAVKEIMVRFLGSKLNRENVLSNPDLTRQFLMAKLRELNHEVFAMVFLDNQNRVISYKELFRGTIDGAAVYPREVVKLALAEGAAAIILVHNHPSGIAEPSQADRAITERLKKALDLIDIRVLDHLIIGDGYCESFSEMGWL